MEVEEFGPAFRANVDELRAAMVGSADQGRPALGLAAPQVGCMQRFFLVQGWPEPFVNPVIERVGGETVVEEEGCLSFPVHVLVPVERPRRVWLSAQNTVGERRRFKLRGRDARCALHELDHLDGILITDRAAA